MSDLEEIDPEYVYESPDEDDGRGQVTQAMIITSLKNLSLYPAMTMKRTPIKRLRILITMLKAILEKFTWRLWWSLRLSNFFIEDVREYTIYHSRDLMWPKNDTIGARTRCKQKGCPWIYLTWTNVTKSFQVKTFVEEHIWSRVFKNKQATMKWVV